MQICRWNALHILLQLLELADTLVLFPDPPSLIRGNLLKSPHLILWIFLCCLLEIQRVAPRWARDCDLCCSNDRFVLSGVEPKGAGQGDLPGPVPSAQGLKGGISEGQAHDESINCPVDMAAFCLDDGTVCGSRKATQACLPGSCGLDDRSLELNSTKCECIPAKPLPPSAHLPVRHDTCFAAFGPPDLCLRKLLDKRDRAEKLVTQLVRLGSLATALVLHRFWISYHAPTMHLDSLLLCAEKMQTELTKCSRSPSSAPKCSSRKEDLVSTSSGLPGLQQQRGSPLQQSLGIPTTPRQTEMWLPPGPRSASPSSTTQLGTRATRPRNQSYLSKLCDAHTLDTLMHQATPGDPDLLRTPSGPGRRSLVGGRAQHSSLTGMRTAFERHCKTATASPSLPKTRTAARAAKFSTASVTR